MQRTMLQEKLTRHGSHDINQWNWNMEASELFMEVKQKFYSVEGDQSQIWRVNHLS